MTNRKLVDLTPSWAHFPGWTVLFDNPGTSGRVDGDIELLECPTACSPAQRLFDQLEQWFLEELSVHLGSLGHAALPRSTYHVTLADGLNLGQLRGLPDQVAEAVEADFASSIAAPRAWSEPPYATAVRGLIGDLASPIRFVLHKIDIRGHAVMAILRPARPEDESRVTTLAAARDHSLTQLGDAAGLERSGSWTPHITLGYLGDIADAPAARRIIDDSLVFDSATIDFESASLYRFASMIDFWRQRPSTG